ncbi:small integral membrane protein 13 isoform X1 [Myxocyprinus asiaticus]|uniref:small integral membrane protein 13 isoform X1 n=2 Tax=Myxocyprinus asiaticus TaxID=70543 RepID=UPI0022218668|nr:small integral membrane protein 13 isoform X1 [Myxocyprinus asiaticus]
MTRVTGLRPCGIRREDCEDVINCECLQGGRMWQSVGLTVLVIVATLICVLLFMLFGWYVVWQLFLSKFKFLRELVGDTGSPQAETEPSESESERSSPLTPRHRPKTARQRIVPPDSTT